MTRANSCAEFLDGALNDPGRFPVAAGQESLSFFFDSCGVWLRRARFPLAYGKFVTALSRRMHYFAPKHLPSLR